MTMHRYFPLDRYNILLYENKVIFFQIRFVYGQLVLYLSVYLSSICHLFGWHYESLGMLGHIDSFCFSSSRTEITSHLIRPSLRWPSCASYPKKPLRTSLTSAGTPWGTWMTKPKTSRKLSCSKGQMTWKSKEKETLDSDTQFFKTPVP